MLKNGLRGALLAFMATFAGVFLFFTFPDWLASTVGRVLPFWFYENEVRGPGCLHLPSLAGVAHLYPHLVPLRGASMRCMPDNFAEETLRRVKCLGCVVRVNFGP